MLTSDMRLWWTHISIGPAGRVQGHPRSARLDQSCGRQRRRHQRVDIRHDWSVLRSQRTRPRYAARALPRPVPAPRRSDQGKYAAKQIKDESAYARSTARPAAGRRPSLGAGGLSTRCGMVRTRGRSRAAVGSFGAIDRVSHVECHFGCHRAGKIGKARQAEETAFEGVRSTPVDVPGVRVRQCSHVHPHRGEEGGARPAERIPESVKLNVEFLRRFSRATNVGRFQRETSRNAVLGLRSAPRLVSFERELVRAFRTTGQ